jgi:hypothetical protein
MTKLLSRRSVTTGMLAAVTAIPAVGLAKEKSPPPFFGCVALAQAS